MKKISLRKIFAGVLIAAAVLICGIASATANDYNDWSGDFGGSDWGDSGSDWGDSGSDWGDSGGSLWIFDDDGISSCGGCGGCCGGTTVFIIIIIVLVIIIINNNKNNKNGGGGGNGGNRPSVMQMSDTSSVDLSTLEELKASDPEFSEAAVLSWAENLYTTMQIAWSEQDYEPLRPFLGNALFEEHAKSLAAKIERDEKNERSEIAVLQKKLESFSTDGHNEYLNVWLRIKMVDKLVKRSDPSIVIHPAKTFYMDFRWQLVRTKGAQTDAGTDGVKTGVCPNCGANINMNQSGKCPYCDSVITTEEHNWVLNKIDRFAQRSE